MNIFEYKTSLNKSMSILCFLNNHDTQHLRSHNGSDVDGETREESEDKPTNIAPQS